MLSFGKALAIGLAVLVAGFPVLAGLELETGASPEASTLPVPQGKELNDTELLQAQGEFWWFLIGFVFAGGGRAVYENWFDEDYGIDRDDLKGVMGSAFGGGIGGSAYATLRAVVAFVP